MSEYDGERENGWLTPPWFLDLVRKVGVIGFDPCTNAKNPTKAEAFFPGTGGLEGHWPKVFPGHLAYINPPYGPHLSGEIDENKPIMRKGKIVGHGTGWAKKIALYHHPSIVLVPTRTDTDWWHELFDWSDMRLLWKSPEFGSRIRFGHPVTGKPGKQPNHASTIFFHFGDEHRMRETASGVFGGHGRFIR